MCSNQWSRIWPYEEMKGRITDCTHSQFAVHALDAIFNQPIFSTPRFIGLSGINKQNAARLLRQMKQDGIITCVREPSGRRAAVYVFDRLMSLVDEQALE